MHESHSTPSERAVALATEFLTRVWGPAHDLDAIDELMTEGYRIWSGGTLVAGREPFKEWVRQFQALYGDAHTEIRETFANAAGDRVVSRWFNTGVNKGIFGLPPDGRYHSPELPSGGLKVGAWPNAGSSVPPWKATGV